LDTRKDGKWEIHYFLRKVQKIRTTLYEKAKSAPNFRFYSLYDKICDKETLECAYLKAMLNKGDPGVDGQTFDAIEVGDKEIWLGELARELSGDDLCPWSRQEDLHKETETGRRRPLGIPNIRDRVAQMAEVKALESIFEADLPDERYAYRNGKNAWRL
jgi:retron-type reverse transcriptase